MYLRGFGSFVVKHRAEKVVRNIGKNMSIIIPAYDIPHFKPSKNFELDWKKSKEAEQLSSVSFFLL